MIYLYGAGGHAKVIADILELNKANLAGYFDDDPVKKIWDYKGYSFPASFDFLEDELIISIGDNATRKRIAEKIKAKYHTAIHPSAVVSPHTHIGEGTVIMAGAMINPDTVTGKHCIINSNAVVDHECVIGDYAHISPNATLCGDVHIGAGTHVGAGAVVIQGKRIGCNTVIGAGTVVINDLPDDIVAVGNPVRIIKRNQDNSY